MVSAVNSAYQYYQANSIYDMFKSINKLNAPNTVYNNAGKQSSLLNMESMANLNSSLVELSNSLKGLPALSSANSLESLQSLSALNTEALKSFNEINNRIYGYNGSGTNASDSTAGQDVKDYLTNIKSASQTLQSSLKTLMGNTIQSPYLQSALSSSDVSKLVVDAAGATSGSFGSMDINIDQLASAQTNTGLALSADASAGGSSLYEFSISKDGSTYNLFVSSDVGDTNQTLQEKMAKAINDKDIGITASVQKDATAGTSTLSIRSNETGSDTKNQFSIQDVYGDLVSRSGADTVTAQAQDAIYRINGGAQQTSSSNTVDLGAGVKATFKEASGDTIKVSMQQDNSGMMSALQGMADSYNKLVTAAKVADSPKALSMNLQLASVVNTYASSLGKVGISMDSDGLMSIDKSKASSAASSGDLQSLFTQGRLSNYGFANRLNDLATGINSNPMKYTDLSSMGMSGFGDSYIYTPFQASRYAQAYTTGLFLNMFV